MTFEGLTPEVIIKLGENEVKSRDDRLLFSPVRLARFQEAQKQKNLYRERI